MKSEYLNNYRLEEVIGLIQVLAFDRDTSRSEEGLKKDMGRDPKSGVSWISIATKHPELFRVRPEKARKERAALIARYVLDYEERNDGDEKRPTLTPDHVSKLIDVAILMHDKQVARNEKWKTFLPLIGVILVATASIVAAIIQSTK